MAEGWLRVNYAITVLLVVPLVSLVALAVMLSSGKDFDTLMEGPELCWLPVSVAAIVLSLAMLTSYIPYRNSGRQAFEVGLEDMTARVEMYLESQGIRYQKDVRVDQIRRSRDHWDTYNFKLEGRAASILIRGREEGDSTLLLVSPWPPDDPAFLEGLDKAIRM
jgi:hypothetical protein